MRFTLRDWDQVWYLVNLPDAKRCPGKEVSDIRSARLTVSRLLRDSGNVSVIRSFLASEFTRATRSIPAHSGALLSELEGRLSRRECLLFQGADMRSGGGLGSSTPKEDAAPLEVWEFVPEDAAPDAAPQPPEDVPVLRFSGGSEAAAPITFVHGSEKPPALAFAHGAEIGPAFEFAGASEGMGTLDYSASVKSPT